VWSALAITFIHRFGRASPLAAKTSSAAHRHRLTRYLDATRGDSTPWLVRLSIGIRGPVQPQRQLQHVLLGPFYFVSDADEGDCAPEGGRGRGRVLGGMYVEVLSPPATCDSMRCQPAMSVLNMS
jgi:hypothetical protein